MRSIIFVKADDGFCGQILRNASSIVSFLLEVLEDIPRERSILKDPYPLRDIPGIIPRETTFNLPNDVQNIFCSWQCFCDAIPSHVLKARVGPFSQFVAEYFLRITIQKCEGWWVLFFLYSLSLHCKLNCVAKNNLL